MAQVKQTFFILLTLLSLGLFFNCASISRIVKYPKKGYFTISDVIPNGYTSIGQVFIYDMNEDFLVDNKDIEIFKKIFDIDGIVHIRWVAGAYGTSTSYIWGEGIKKK